MNENRRKELIDTFIAKGVNNPCPRCNGLDLSIIGEGQIILGPTVAVERSIPAYVPAVVMYCKTCGYLMNHLADKLSS
jgi:hypothetical protein